MLPNQKSKADFVSVDGGPEIPVSEASQIIYDAFTSFAKDNNKQGLSASKYAPHNLKKTEEEQRNKAGGTSKHAAAKDTERAKGNSSPINTNNTQRKERGLNASKHAPHNVKQTNQTQRNKPSGTWNKGNGLNASRHAPKDSRQTDDTLSNKPNTLHTKDNNLNTTKFASRNLGKSNEAPRHDLHNTKGKQPATRTNMAPPVNFDDPSAFLAAMNRNFPPTTAAPGEGESGPGASASVKSTDKTPNVSSPKTGTETQEASNAVPMIPTGATRVVQIIGVDMNHGMGWIYHQVTEGGYEVEKVLDTFVPGGSRTVSYLFKSLESSVAYHNSSKENPGWHGCQIDFAPESSI